MYLNIVYINYNFINTPLQKLPNHLSFQEHKCVLDSCRALEGVGFKVTYLPVGPNGIINLQDLEEALTPETSLVSIMTVNNEIGEFIYFYVYCNT